MTCRTTVCRLRSAGGGRRLPAHEVIHAVRVDVLEAEALVEAQRGIEAFHVDGYGLTGLPPPLQDLLDQPRSDSAAAGLGHEGDVHEADLVLPFVDPQPA